jgi:hypothetical protein
MAVASFAPTESFDMAVTQQSQNVALPTTGAPTICFLQNLGEQIIYAQLVASGTAEVAPRQGMAIYPRTPPFPLTIGANTNLTAVTLAGLCGLNVTVGN